MKPPFIIDYDFDDFISYAYYVREEMTRRGYRTMNSVWDKIVALKPDYYLLPLSDIYPKKMDHLYFNICLYNLCEKHLCGGISDEDWMNIRDA